MGAPRLRVGHRGEGGDRFIDVTTDVDLYRAALAVVRTRNAEGWYGNEAPPDRALVSGTAAWKWMQTRSEAEYEGYTLAFVEDSTEFAG